MNPLPSIAAALRGLYSCLAPACRIWCAAAGRLARRLGWRGALLALAALPALLLLYALLLIPFTPAISDIRKAATEQPAQIMSADGKRRSSARPRPSSRPRS